MSYARWTADSDWYVFWEGAKAGADAAALGSPKPKEAERLAIWRCRRQEKPAFSYLEVREMLSSADFSRIPGFEEPSRKQLQECMQAFVEDVERDEKYRG